MDQLPLGKGKKVWLCFPASASIVLSIYTKAGAGVCFKTPRSPCFSTVSDFTTSCVHALTFSKSWSWDCLFQLRPHTVLHSCMIFFAPCYSVSFIWLLARIYSHSNYLFHITALQPCKLESLIYILVISLSQYGPI